MASASYRYFAFLLSKNRYSCAFVGRSVTLSGIGLGLCQTMSARKYQPSARKAKATAHGTPQRSFAFSPPVPLLDAIEAVNRRSARIPVAPCEPRFVRCFWWVDSGGFPAQPLTA